MTTKQCTKCYVYKKLNEFGVKNVNKDNRDYYCISCRREYNTWQRINNPNVLKGERKYEVKRRIKLKQGKFPHRKKAEVIRAVNRQIVKRIIANLNVREVTVLKNFGCSKKVFIERFEKYFKKNPGMGWHNYGAWHLDHIKPMKAFKLDTPESIKECNYYTNIRPQWATFNMQKATKYEVGKTI